MAKGFWQCIQYIEKNPFFLLLLSIVSQPPASVCGDCQKKKAGNRVMKYALEIKPAFRYKNNSGRESSLLIPAISSAI